MAVALWEQIVKKPLCSLTLYLFFVGPATALSLVDVSILCSILSSIPDFWDQPTPQQTGPYKVKTKFLLFSFFNKHIVM